MQIAQNKTTKGFPGAEPGNPLKLLKMKPAKSVFNVLYYKQSNGFVLARLFNIFFISEKSGKNASFLPLIHLVFIAYSISKNVL